MKPSLNAQLPLPIPGSGVVENKLARLLQKQARLEEEKAEEENKLQRLVHRAHYQIGEFVIGDPALYALIKEKLEAHIAQLPEGRRRPVLDYAANKAALEQFRNALK